MYQSCGLDQMVPRPSCRSHCNKQVFGNLVHQAASHLLQHWSCPVKPARRATQASIPRITASGPNHNAIQAIAQAIPDPLSIGEICVGDIPTGLDGSQRRSTRTSLSFENTRSVRPYGLALSRHNPPAAASSLPLTINTTMTLALGAETQRLAQHRMVQRNQGAAASVESTETGSAEPMNGERVLALRPGDELDVA